MNQNSLKRSPRQFQAQFTSLRLVRERSVEYSEPITSPALAYSLLRPLMEDLAQEAFFVVGLDSKNQVTVIHQVAMGFVDSVTFNPADIARVLLLSASTGCLVSHNHPSGNCEPSLEDRKLTDRIREITTLLGIRFLDHIIVGDDRFYSFQDTKI